MTTSTPTQRLRLEKQATGQNLNTWGQRLNDSGIALIEEAIAGVTAKALSGNVTLTSTNYEADESRRAILVFTDDGLFAKPTVTIPAVEKVYLVHNKGSEYDIDITCGGAVATVGPGLIVSVYCDGTDCFNTDEARLAEIAKDAAEAAQLAAEGARDDAIDAKDDAEAAAIATDLDRTAVAEDRTAVENALETAEIQVASEAEAIEGENNGKVMTPLRTAQAIAAQGTIPIGGVIMWSGSIASIPENWALCDGFSGTPDLRNRFVVGAGGDYDPNDTGGADSVTLTTGQIPSHTHSFSATTGTAGSHSHSASTNSAGSHSHSGSTNSTGSHSHTSNVTTSTSGSGAASVQLLTDGISGAPVTGSPQNTGSAGNHSHSLNINSAGSHSHSVSVSSAGNHSHSVSGTTGSTGSGNSHENRPPYYALAYIMRVA